MLSIFKMKRNIERWREWMKVTHKNEKKNFKMKAKMPCSRNKSAGWFYGWEASRGGERKNVDNAWIESFRKMSAKKWQNDPQNYGRRCCSVYRPAEKPEVGELCEDRCSHPAATTSLWASSLCVFPSYQHNNQRGALAPHIKACISALF